jgi:hypothetical protein
MITSIFRKSKPINSVIVIAFTVLLYVLTYYGVLVVSFDQFLLGLVNLVVVVFFILLLGFINAKNKLVPGNDYILMSIGLMLFMFPSTMGNTKLLLSNLFVLLAIRRLISLQSNLYVKKKLFDAGFWIAVATLFYFWALLFFPLVIVALIYHAQNDIKNIIIPFIGIATVLVLLVTYNLLFFDVYIKPSDFERLASVDYADYNDPKIILKLTVLFSAFIWTLVFYFKSLSDKNKSIRPSYFLLAWAAVLAVLVALIAPIKNGSEFIFLLVPFSIVLAIYIESIADRWFREVFVALFIVTPLISLLI